MFPWLIFGGAALIAVLVGETLKANKETAIVTRQGFANGLDVSHDNGNIGWPAVAAQGVQFAFIKATEGITIQDAMFKTNVAGALAAGLRAYAYHFFIPGDDPNAQAQNFIAQVQGSGVTAVAVDLESEGLDYVLASSDKDGTILGQFLAAIGALGLPIFIYATDSFLGQYYPDANLSNFGRWKALWEATEPPTPWAFWQYTDSGLIPGISGEVDLDYFNGGNLP